MVKGSTIMMNGIRSSVLYVLEGKTITSELTVTLSASIDRTKLWHLRLGQMSQRGLTELFKQGLLGDDKISALVLCDDCVIGKSTKTSFKSSMNTSKDMLDYVHLDLWGPVYESSLGVGKKS